MGTINSVTQRLQNILPFYQSGSSTSIAGGSTVVATLLDRTIALTTDRIITTGGLSARIRKNAGLGSARLRIQVSIDGGSTFQNMYELLTSSASFTWASDVTNNQNVTTGGTGTRIIVRILLDGSAGDTTSEADQISAQIIIHSELESM